MCNFSQTNLCEAQRRRTRRLFSSLDLFSFLLSYRLNQFYFLLFQISCEIDKFESISLQQCVSVANRHGEYYFFSVVSDHITDNFVCHWHQAPQSYMQSHALNSVAVTRETKTMRKQKKTNNLTPSNFIANIRFSGYALYHRRQMQLHDCFSSACFQLSNCNNAVYYLIIKLLVALQSPSFFRLRPHCSCCRSFSPLWLIRSRFECECFIFVLLLRRFYFRNFTLIVIDECVL